MPERECGPYSIFALDADIRLTTKENHGKTLSSVAERCQLGAIKLILLTGRLDSLSDLLYFCLALQVTRVNSLSAQISAELSGVKVKNVWSSYTSFPPHILS